MGSGVLRSRPLTAQKFLRYLNNGLPL